MCSSWTRAPREPRRWRRRNSVKAVRIAEGRYRLDLPLLERPDQAFAREVRLKIRTNFGDLYAWHMVRYVPPGKGPQSNPE